MFFDKIFKTLDFLRLLLKKRNLTNLTNEIRIIAFQLISFQQEFKLNFFQKLQKTLNLINKTHFKLSTITSKKKQIRSNFRNLVENYFFSFEWVVNKTKLRITINKFLKNTAAYRLIFQKLRKFESIFFSSTFVFTNQKSSFVASSLHRHIKTNSAFEKIFIVWSNIVEFALSSSDVAMSNSDNFNAFNEFSSAQLVDLVRFMSQVIDNKIIELRGTAEIVLSNSNSNNSMNTDYRQIFKNWSTKDIEFFDSAIEETESIVNIDKHVFYRNIYTFIDKLKNMITIKDDIKLKTVISQCLRESVLIWHSIELTNFEKKMLRETSLSMWYNVMIKRFKEQTSVALISMQITKYTLDDAKQLKDSKMFAQNLFKFAKAANLTSIHNQLTIVWNNLTWQFKQHISESTEDTSIRKFLKQLDNHVSMWHEMSIFKDLSDTFDLSSSRRYSKSFYQNYSERNSERISYFNRDSRFSFKSNNAYQNSRQKHQNDRSSRIEVTIKIEKTNDREFDKNEFDRDDRNKAFDKKDRYRNMKESKILNKRNKYRNNYNDKEENKDKAKVRTYLTQEDFDQKDDEIVDYENYHHFEELIYFDSDYEEFDDFENIILVNNVISQNIFCRRCQADFVFNNSLHKHLRSNICKEIEKFFKSITIHVNTKDSCEISLIYFDVNFKQDLSTDYDFRDWQYCIAQVSFIKNATSESSCLNIETDITLTDTKFLQRQFKNISIRIMTTLITVRELETNRHQTNKYALVTMHFKNTNKIDQVVQAVIIRKIHLIDDLKVNLLIDNDILSSKLIDISTSINSTYIENCKMTIFISIKTRFRSRNMSVHTLKAIVIFLKSDCLVDIHNITLSDQNYLFESDVAEFSIYAHVINLSIKFILMRNEENRSIKISKNFRFEVLTDMSYSDAYLIDSASSDFVIKSSKKDHKIFWFNKVLTVFFVISSNSDDVETSKFAKNITFENDVIIHNSSDKALKIFTNIIHDYFKLWKDQDFAKLLMKNWMRISLKFDWEKIIKEKAKIYSLNFRDKIVLNDTFNDLQKQNKLFWITNSTFFSFSCFIVWREQSENKKDRVIVDVRELNAITQSNAYSVSLQSDIIQAVSECFFIFVIDCFEFFYQWKVHSNERHKFTIVTHREQKSFNVTVMRFRNSSTYVQRQIDRILRSSKNAKIYIDDIVIFFRILKDHLIHLREMFDILKFNNISIKSSKSFIEYSSVSLLEQHVNSFDFATDEQKLKAIFSLTFSRTLKQLETYLNLTDWFREYIKEYVEKIRFLQKKKTALLRNASLSEKERKFYTSKTKLIALIENELIAFNMIQHHFSKAFFLIHFDLSRQLYVDLNTSKKNDMNAMIYHVLKKSHVLEESHVLEKFHVEDTYSSKMFVQLILFLSKLLNVVESRYWSTKLKLVELIWIFRKIRHLIESTKQSTIIYTNHDAALNIAKQINLSTFSIDKLNLRLIRVSNYIQRFFLIIRHKSNKLHIVSDALFRLVSSNISFNSSFEKKLNVLFTASMIEMNKSFKKNMIDDYKNDLEWKKIIDLLKRNSDIELFFLWNDDILYKREISTDTTSFKSRRMCVSQSMIKEILIMTHDDFNEHIDFDRTYQKIINSWYIRDLFKHLTNYLKHCSQCSVNRTRRHRFYDNLQLIFSSSISFHIIFIDFVLALSNSHIEMNIIMFVIDKFSKRIIIVSDKDTWTASLWIEALLNRLNIANWSLFKIIIFDKDRKFLFDLWFALFNRFEIKLLYFTAYHSQIDEFFERINQTLKIAFRYHFQTLSDHRNWSSIINVMQRTFNNEIAFIEKSSNEICYGFTSLQSTDLIRSSNLAYENDKAKNARLTVADSIVMTQVVAKSLYDMKHQKITLKIEDWALLRLHKRYKIFFTVVLKRKLSQQYCELFKILEKIDFLTYKLNIFSHWKIWSIIFISQLEFSSTFIEDSFNRTQSSLNSVIMKKNDENVKLFEIEKIIAKRHNRRRKIKYLVKWFEYESENDSWRSFSELQNVMNVIRNFDAMNSSSFVDEKTTYRKKERFNKSITK